MQLKEASFEELIQESDKLSQKQFTIDEHLSKTNKFTKQDLNSKLFLDIGRSTGVPDVDLSSMPKNTVRNGNNSNSK